MTSSLSPAPMRLMVFPGGWGQPSFSPFCSKVEALMRLVGQPYTRLEPSGPPKSKTGKLPYAEGPDGALIEGSDAIVGALIAAGRDPDAGLSPAQRATSHLARRMIEEHLYFAVVKERWIDEAGFAHTRRDYFAGQPAPVRLIVPLVLRRQIRRDAHGQGLSRVSPQRFVEKISEDLDSLVTLLGDQPYYFGERPHQLDAVSWAFLGGALATPGGGPFGAAVRARPSLLAHVERFAAAVFEDTENNVAG